MTASEQANRTADRILELVQARRQLAAVRALCIRARNDMTYLLPNDVEAALRPQPAPTSSDPEEVPAR